MQTLYCLKCGEALEPQGYIETGEKKESFFSSSRHVRYVLCCLNKECPYLGLAAIRGLDDLNDAKEIRNTFKAS